MTTPSPLPQPTRTAAPALWVEICLKESLAPHWCDWFGELALDALATGQARLSGALPDQAALHGVLERIRDLNLQLISVQVRELNGEGAPDRRAHPAAPISR